MSYNIHILTIQGVNSLAQSSVSDRLPLEQAALGLLMAGPRHGYELHAEFVQEFGSIWHAGRSRFYAALQQLERDGLTSCSVIEQERRPARKVLALTPAGRESFLAWVGAPILRIREIRVAFLAKLHFHRLLALDGGRALVDAQVTVCRERLHEYIAKPDAGQDTFAHLVSDFRRRQILALIDWLEACREYSP